MCRAAMTIFNYGMKSNVLRANALVSVPKLDKLIFITREICAFQVIYGTRGRPPRPV